MLDILALVKDLVACSSITPNDAGCQQILSRYLRAWDFEITEIPHQQACNFWATHRDNARPRLVLAGHTDVVPAGNLEAWQYPPFVATVDGDRIYGRGTADMKAGLVAMLAAVEKLRQSDPEKAKDIGFLITSAEEGPSQQGTPIVLEYLQNQDIHFNWCIVGEPSSSERLGDTIKNGRRGSLTGKLIVKGKQGHIAYPHLALNPITVLAPFLQAFTTAQWDQGNTYFQPTQMQVSNIHAGTGAGNVIPGELELLFNFRYSPETSATQLIATTEKLLAQFQLSYTLEWTHFGEPFLTVPDTLTTALTQAIETICQITPELSTTGGTSDARYIAKTGAQVVEFGLCNGTIHQHNEYVLLNDIHRLSDIYYHVFKRLL